MGRFSTTVHVKDNVGRIEFINSFCGIMKKRRFVPCSEDEAEQSYVFAFGDGWVTLANKDYKDDRLKAGDDAMNMSAALKTSAFMIDVIDSDFAYIHLFAPNGGKDGVAVGDASGYGVEKLERGTQKLWEPLLSEGKTWEQFSETVAKNAVFVEDTFVEMAEELKIDPDYIYADFDELMNLAGEDKNVQPFYFKSAAEKRVTLKAAFKRVFGEALEPLGFKLIKSKYPYFVRVVSNEIVHYVTFANETADGRGSFGVKYKCFSIYCGVSTVYNSKIDFDTDPRKLFFCGLNSVFQIYTKSHWYDLDNEYSDSIYEFYYNPTSTEDMLKVLKRALKVTEDTALPVINPAVTLEKCMDYFGVMEHFICPTLGDSGEGLLCTKIFSADEFVMFCGRSCEREIERCRRELDSNFNLSPKRRASLEERIKYIMSRREEGKKKSYEFFANPELKEKAPVELERRKKENIERLRVYGLNI